MKRSSGALVLAVLLAVSCRGQGGGADVDGGGDGGGTTGGGECRGTADCQGVGDYPTCVAPGKDSFGGAVCGACLSMDDECDVDADCGPGRGCRPEGPCGCGQALRICVPGCQSDADCLDGQRCDDQSHCLTRTCSADGDCPAQFGCNQGSCARRACSSDDDCDGDGACVQSQCHAGPGSCVNAVPVP
jgi:hypothetical protein